MSNKHDLSLLEFLQTHRRGELLERISTAHGEVMAGVQATGLPGSLTVKLVWKRNKSGQIECHPAVKADVPVKPVGVGIYYLTDDARLTRRDPDQLDLVDELEARRDRAAGSEE